MAAGIVLIIVGGITRETESVDGLAQTEHTTVVERRVD